MPRQSLSRSFLLKSDDLKSWTLTSEGFGDTGTTIEKAPAFIYIAGSMRSTIGCIDIPPPNPNTTPRSPPPWTTGTRLFDEIYFQKKLSEGLGSGRTWDLASRQQGARFEHQACPPIRPLRQRNSSGITNRPCGDGQTGPGRIPARLEWL